MILDCRATNLLFKTPPAASLATGEGLGKIELDIGDANDAIWASQLKLAFGVADVSDSFHRMVLDRKMSEYFRWPPVLARAVGIEVVNGVKVDGDELIWPMQRTLGIGFSWATFLAQNCNLGKLEACLTGWGS